MFKTNSRWQCRRLYPSDLGARDAVSIEGQIQVQTTRKTREEGAERRCDPLHDQPVGADRFAFSQLDHGHEMRFDPRNVGRCAVACVAMMRAMHILLPVCAMRSVPPLALLSWRVRVVLVTAMSTVRVASGLGLRNEVHAAFRAGAGRVGGDFRVHGAGVGACRLCCRFGVIPVVAMPVLAVVRMASGLGPRDKVHAAFGAGAGCVGGDLRVHGANIGSGRLGACHSIRLMMGLFCLRGNR